ncbi:MAG TPA: MogA/MoaB family molybdenum cofactor biosynthesis protein [Solirubrobacteraceae bacterium]|nr:MogA/MoaB family molybdenum cofactor biosynthesis protein [Solirubrobacteraceae bacterium]
MRAAVLSISTSRARGERTDESGPKLAEFALAIGAEVAGVELLPDTREVIEARLCHWADSERCDLILTTGGTGFAPSDLTPEASRAVIEREAPGIAEALRAGSREHTRHWMLSRGVAGIRGRTLIVNFPGSPASIAQAGAAIAASLPHAIELLAGEGRSHA